MIDNLFSKKTLGKNGYSMNEKQRESFATDALTLIRIFLYYEE